MNLYDLLHLENFNSVLLMGLVLRFVFNVGMAAALIIFVYRKNCQNKEFAFTLFSFNMIIFALCTILNNVELSVGSGFGLFAVFTMMRYRSEQLQIKDMTYLLVLVAMGFINSTFQGSIGPFEIMFLNISMITFLLVLEKTLFNQKIVKQKIKYDNLDLLKVGNQSMLRKDLEDKLGARIEDIQIESINYPEGSANIVVKYNRKEPVISSPVIFRKQVEEEQKSKDKLLMKGL